MILQTDMSQVVTVLNILRKEQVSEQTVQQTGLQQLYYRGVPLNLHVLSSPYLLCCCHVSSQPFCLYLMLLMCPNPSITYSKAFEYGARRKDKTNLKNRKTTKLLDKNKGNGKVASVVLNVEEHL